MEKLMKTFVFTFIYVTLQTLQPCDASARFSCLQVLSKNKTPERQFCMVYYPQFKELAPSQKEAKEIKLVNASLHDGCSELPVKYDREAAFTFATNVCPVEKVIVNFQKANAAALILSTPKSEIEAINVNDTKSIDMVVGYVTESTADSLFAMMRETDKLDVKMFDLSDTGFDYSLVATWLIAVFTVAVGAYWSGKVRMDLYIAEQQHRGQDCRFLNGGNGFQENKISQSGSLQAYPENTRRPPPEESSLDVSPLLVSLFVVCMGAMLILLYFFFQYLVHFIIFMFAVASITSTIGVLEPIVERIPIGTTKIPRRLLPCFYGSLQIRQLVLILFAIGVTATWLVVRHEPWSWALQDLLGVAFSLNMLRSLRLPNLFICSVLLVLLFFYDIFFVFVTPFLTLKGESVMVEVARGAADSQEQLPMVLRIPHLGSDPLSVCFSHYSILGFGDILVPGLLVSYCHAFDLLHRGRSCKLYYVTSVFCYGLGLLLTFVALYLMKTAQPALLYLVPCTLLPVVMIALCRGEFRAMWKGQFNVVANVNGNTLPQHTSNNAALPPYGATEADPSPIYQTDPALLHN